MWMWMNFPNPQHSVHFLTNFSETKKHKNCHTNFDITFFWKTLISFEHLLLFCSIIYLSLTYPFLGFAFENTTDNGLGDGSIIFQWLVDYSSPKEWTDQLFAPPLLHIRSCEIYNIRTDNLDQPVNMTIFAKRTFRPIKSVLKNLISWFSSLASITIDHQTKCINSKIFHQF